MLSVDQTGLAFVLAARPHIFEIWKWETISSDIVEHTIREALSDIPEVQEIYRAIEDDVVEVWTALADTGRSVRRTVYERELQIRDRLPGFYFNFTTSGLSSASTPRSSGYRRIYPR